MRALGRVAADVAVHLVHMVFIFRSEVGLLLVQNCKDVLAGVAADTRAVTAIEANRL